MKTEDIKDGFNIGDVVRLKTGSPKMLITEWEHVSNQGYRRFTLEWVSYGSHTPQIMKSIPSLGVVHASVD